MIRLSLALLFAPLGVVVAYFALPSFETLLKFAYLAFIPAGCIVAAFCVAGWHLGSRLETARLKRRYARLSEEEEEGA